VLHAPSRVGRHCVLLLISHGKACLSSSPLSLLQGVVAPPCGHRFLSRSSSLRRAEADLEGSGSLTIQPKVLFKHHLKDLKYPRPAWLFRSKISVSKPWRDEGSLCLFNPLPVDSGYQLCQFYFSSSSTCISLQTPRGKEYLGIRGVNSFPGAPKQILQNPLGKYLAAGLVLNKPVEVWFYNINQLKRGLERAREAFSRVVYNFILLIYFIYYFAVQSYFYSRQRGQTPWLGTDLRAVKC